jgi:hypothetical protein
VDRILLEGCVESPSPLVEARGVPEQDFHVRLRVVVLMVA